MRVFCLLILLVFSLRVAKLEASSLAPNHIEFDLNERGIKFANFPLGDISIEGDFSFDIKRNDDSVIITLDGKEITLTVQQEPTPEQYQFDWVRLKLLKRKDAVVINYFYSPQFMVRGKIDLVKETVSLDVEVNSWEGFVGGTLSGAAKVWGTLGNFRTSGKIIIEEGSYQGADFARLMMSFFGKFPLLDLTDSEVTLNDGSIYKIEGVIVLKDLDNFLSRVQLVSHRMILGDWEMISSQSEKAGLKKDLSDRMDIRFDAQDEDGQTKDPGTELRYRLRKNDYLKMRTEEGKTIMGIERRHEF